jgi:MinD-like ATPase involved in chromosome partitioning or flagellar assembly
MNPTSLTPEAIATLTLAKALEKTGEKIEKKVREQGDRLLQLLKERFAFAAMEVNLTEYEPLNGDRAAIIAQKVGEAAKADSEVAQTVQAIADAVQSKPDCIEKFMRIAQEIKMEVEGQIVSHPRFNI